MSCHMEPLLQHLLNQDLAWVLQAATQELLQQRTRDPSIPIRLPDPRQGALRLLPKLTTADRVDTFLYMFKQMAIRECWPEEEWAQALTPMLSGEVQLTHLALPPASAEEYLLLK